METGKSAVSLTMSRTKDGVLVNFKSTPALEEFFKQLGDGTEISVADQNMYNKWLPVSGNAPLKVWSANMESLGQIAEGQKFRLDLPGYGLEINQDLGSAMVVNLSFLRLVGTSQPNGVTFLINKSVISKSGLLDTRDRLLRCIKYMYNEYIRPVSAEGFIYETSLSD